MNVKDIRKILLEIEAETGVMEDRIDDVRYWERIRFDVFNAVVNKSDAREDRSTTKGRNVSELARGVWLWGRNLAYRSPFFADDADLFVFGHPRRKLREDDRWWDLYCDPYLIQTDRDYQYFEYDFRFEHRSPTPTTGVRYVDFIEYSGTIAKKLDLFYRDLSSDVIAAVEDEIAERIGVDVDVHGRVRDELTSRRVKLPLYERLLARVDPEVVLLVVSYGKETFIEAAKRSGVPVAELQHGIITPYFGYDYPGDRTKETFPDYLLTWGEFWSGAAAFPIDSDRVLPVGFPYLEAERERYADVETGNSVVFISQHGTGSQLVDIATELATARPDLDVVFKLHPEEYDSWREIYPSLKDADARVVASDSPPLYQLFSEALAQVGISSTAVFEGIAFGLDTYLLHTEEAPFVDQLVETGYPVVFDDTSELVDDLDQNSETAFDVEDVFRPKATENIDTAVEEIVADSGRRHETDYGS